MAIVLTNCATVMMRQDRRRRRRGEGEWERGSEPRTNEILLNVEHIFSINVNPVVILCKKNLNPLPHKIVEKS